MFPLQYTKGQKQITKLQQEISNFQLPLICYLTSSILCIKRCLSARAEKKLFCQQQVYSQPEMCLLY